VFADTYNELLGFSGACKTCPGGIDSNTTPDPNVVTPPGAVYTSYAAAQQCDVKRLDLQCRGGECAVQ